jgi:hypothetical protein
MPISRFASSGHTELEKDADLAIFLVNHLDSLRDAATGSWPGERETRRLQNTCHAVESLYELNLGLISQRLVEPGVKWLIDLPILREVLKQDHRPLRVYPMRFKTLAALNRFSDPRVHKDFTALCNYMDPHSGWLADVPGEFSRVMNTMVWADTLLFLKQYGVADVKWIEQLPLALDALENGLNQWMADPYAAKTSADIKGVREVSYVFEILAREGRLSPQSETGLKIRDALIKEAANSTRDRLRATLYYGLQLATYFPSDPTSTIAVNNLIREARDRYEAGSQAGQPEYFHAIVLRLLHARHQDALRETILETLWLRNRQAAEYEEDQIKQKQHAALTALIHQHVNVKLGQVTRLSGTRTRAAVYRTHFSLESDATDRDGRPYSILPDSLQLIIKQGSIESLSRTIRRYNELPLELRRYFARHSDKTETSGDGWYLTMEDLVGMQPLSEVLDRIDLRWAGRAEHETMTRVASAIGLTLRALHQHRRREPIASNELGWLYLNPISEALNAVCEPNSLYELKSYIEIGFEANGCSYQRLNNYMVTLQQHAAILTPPAVSAVHGDCHSRNLMIDGPLGNIKFVDLETLTYTDDWVVDYGLLLEDVSLYRYLPRGQRPDALTTDEIAAAPSAINYPPLPRGADSILFFQSRLLDQMAAFAATVNDMHYKPRLWLAIVRNLIELINRQLPVHLLDPHRRDETLKLSLVAYAEAARLLQELTSHLNAPEAVPLPELPFSSTR